MASKIPPDAFEYYSSLGPSRSYEAVAKHYGVSKRSVTKRAAKERWQERAAEIERKVRESTDKKRVETLEAVRDRHLASLRIIQQKSLEALRSMSIDSAADAARCLAGAIKDERVVLGEPGDRTAFSVEDVIKKEMDRWLISDTGSTSESDETEEPEDTEETEEPDGDNDE